MSIRIEHGDCLEVMARLHEEGVLVDSVVTDPPYHLTSIVKRFGKDDSAPAKSNGATGVYGRAAAGFMGQKWDGGDVAFRSETWRLAFELLKPGGHILVFGGTRTYHRLACAIEDAGFEIRDTICWLFGSGFPKNHNVAKKVSVCDCGENPLPYDHGNEAPEHDLRPLRTTDLPSAIDTCDKRGQVLFEGLPEQGSQKIRTARPEPETCGEEQPGLEGGSVRRTGQGLRNGSEARSPESAEERICVRAHSGGGEDAGASADAGRGSPPPEPEQGGQQVGEPEGLCNSSRTLDDGALSGRGRCPRCGKLRKEFVGFGTALKPAAEFIVLARKPLDGTVAANVLEHGTGALNIDGCRVVAEKPTGWGGKAAGGQTWNEDNCGLAKPGNARPVNGRWPANVIHDGSAEVLEAFAVSGDGKGAAAPVTKRGSDKFRNSYGKFPGQQECGATFQGDTGTAARFFYTAKADKADRLGSKHPTVKPVDLMAYLCRLITPPGGLVLDPFAGSGTTAMAALREGFDAILIEKEARFVADIKRRLAHVEGADTPLFQGAPI